MDDKDIKNYKVFLFSISLTIVLFVMGLFLGGAVRTKTLIYKQVLTEARAHFNSIVLTRKWNASHGGVYIEKKDGTKSNQYLEDPDIVTDTGVVYTAKVPAVMTREISEYADREGRFMFSISSLKPLNPGNRPDGFEKAALESFEKGEKEASAFSDENGVALFKYMAPLYIEEACLKCHYTQGYKVGDIRGGISVTLNVEEIQKELRHNFLVIIVLGVLSATLLIGVIGLFTMKLLRTLSQARREIEELAITDGLTGIFNRRHLFTRFSEAFERSRRLKQNLGCILMDIDHFKRINDTFGHLVGDQVLRGIAQEIQRTLRAYDHFGRYGGEEFMVVLPDTGIEEATALAERIREAVKLPILPEGAEGGLNITVSLGVSCLSEGDESEDDIMKRADRALYCAKQAGRDQVCSE
jgi:diguanylate cyclase (GGDEF)-like protein